MTKDNSLKPMTFDKGYKQRTLWIGLAFFGILLVWQLYNTYCSPMLTFLYVKADYIEAFNAFNAAGLLDDKGKPLVATVTNLLANINPDTGEHFLTEDQFLDVQWKVGIIMALDNIAALFIMPLFGGLSDKTHTKLGKRMPYIIVGSIVTAIALPFIPFFFNSGMGENAAIKGMVAGMIATMVVIIVFMMSYRSPAVALMPDLTPKPLRSKANGIINIVGYVGGAVGSVFGIVLPVTSYINGTNKSFWMLEVPFITCSVILLVSLGILLYKVRENKLHEELDAEIKRGDSMGESAEQVTTNDKLSKTNIRNLALILIAEVFWFMSFNALETFQTNYCMFWLNTSSGGGAIMTVVSGAASVVGFIFAGKIADKIGRKWTIFTGICIVVVCYFVYSLVPQVKAEAGTTLFTSSLPWIFFVILPIVGFATSLIHICSFPLVTDYCTADKLGKFTSLYYTASMLAQSVTPIIIGFIFRLTGWNALPIYSLVLIFLAGVVFFFVKAPHSNDRGVNAKGLEALGGDD